MSRPLTILCAALLFAAAGCTLDSFLVSIPGPGAKQRVVTGSVDQVSANLQSVLGNAGIAVTASHDGRDVRLAGVTRSGKKFALVLKAQYATAGQRTSVAIEWADGADDEFWLNIVQVLATRGPKNGPAMPQSSGQQVSTAPNPN